VKLATSPPSSPGFVRPGRRPVGLPTEDMIRAAFSPVQAEILLVLVSRPPEKHVSAGEAAELIGWTYDTFRKEPAFDLANVAPPGRRKRYAAAKLVRIAKNLRQ
jgi:hypothetical protein